MRFLSALLVPAFCLIGCSVDLPPAPKYIARCNVHGGAAPPRGSLEGVYTATYYFVSSLPASCDDAKNMPGAMALTVTPGTGTQNYTLTSGTDPQLEASYAPHPQAELAGPDGQRYQHHLIDGLPGYVRSGTDAQCVAKKLSALNQPSGTDAAELALEIVNCSGVLFSR